MESGLTICYMLYSLDRQFSSDEVLQLLDRFFNLEMLVSGNPISELLCYISLLFLSYICLDNRSILYLSLH